MKSIFSVAALIATVFLFGCDMRHAVRVDLKDGVAANNERHTVRDVMATLRPVIDANDLKCSERVEEQLLEVKCKTWSLSLSSLRIIDKSGTVEVIVEDESPIFFWTPQPYGRIRKEVIKALKSKYGEDHLDCGEGFGLRIHCNEWPQEKERNK